MFLHKIDDEMSLRPFRIDDAEELFHLTISSKSYLKEWLGWLDYTQKVEDSAQFIKLTLQGMIETGGYPKSVAIIYQKKIVGTIGFNEIDKTNSIGKIGYWLGEVYQGKGIMKKALNAIVDYGFKSINLNRIEIRVATENQKSRALPVNLGFVEEGRIRQAEWLYDHYVDHIVYGLLKEEWTQRK